MLLGVQCSQLGPEDSAAHKFSCRGRKSACRGLSSRLLQTNEIMNDRWLAAGNNGIDPRLCYGPHTRCCTDLQSHTWSLRMKRKKKLPSFILLIHRKQRDRPYRDAIYSPQGSGSTMSSLRPTRLQVEGALTSGILPLLSSRHPRKC